MKKLICMILALILTLSMAACGSDSKKSENEAGNLFDNDTGKTNASKIAFEELTVVDNDECVIKITGIDPDDFWGFTLKVQLENKSAQTTYMFSVDGASINGVETDPFFATEVAPGKKSNEDINFSDDELEELLGLYTDISLSFQVYDTNDWLADPVAETTVHVYPYGEENATVYSRKGLETDTVILDNEYVFATVIDYEYDDIWGYTANLYLINKTDTDVMFTAEDVSVNGFMCDPYFAASVGAGNCAFASITWSDTSFAENGISAVEEIEMTMRAYDYEDWLAEDFANETVTLNP